MLEKFYEQSGVNLSESDKLNTKLLHLNNKNMGKFAGSVPFNDYEIVNCCDGIGSKIIPLYDRKMYKTIAIDLIAANLNDMATRNAKAVMFSDYIAVNKLDSEAISSIVFELENELNKYGCKLCGGETSEIPHLLREGTIDICGFAVGLESCLLKREESNPSDVIIGFRSSGVHANGFTLIRKLYSEGKLSESEFEACLLPSFVYYDKVRILWEHKLIKTAANVTGGGIVSNLKRILPQGFNLNFEKIPKQEIFEKLKLLVGSETWDVFNCGVGFCVVLSPENVENVLRTIDGAFVFGEVK